VVVRVELAGTEPRDIHVRATDSQLIVGGARRDPTGSRPRRIDRMEIAFGPFERIIPLPALVVAENARASLRGGLLEVVLPLASAQRVRSVAFSIAVLSTER
jgi:HSP20 family protein